MEDQHATEAPPTEEVKSPHTLILDDSKPNETQRSLISEQESVLRIQKMSYQKILKQIKQLLLALQTPEQTFTEAEKEDHHQKIKELKTNAQAIYSNMIQSLEDSNVVGLGAENIQSVEEFISTISASPTPTPPPVSVSLSQPLETISENPESKEPVRSSKSSMRRAVVPSSDASDVRTSRASNRSTVDEVTRTNYDTSQDVQVNKGTQKKPNVTEHVLNRVVGFFKGARNRNALAAPPANTTTPEKQPPPSSSSARVRFDVQNPPANNDVAATAPTLSTSPPTGTPPPNQQLPKNLFDYLFGKWGGKKHACGFAYSEY